MVNVIRPGAMVRLCAVRGAEGADSYAIIAMSEWREREAALRATGRLIDSIAVESRESAKDIIQQLPAKIFSAAAFRSGVRDAYSIWNGI